MKRRLLLQLLVVSLAACSGAASAPEGAAASPEPIAEHECGTCGMIVREQVSPRAQIVHRDGTREWFCSMADVVAYLGSPSAHGRIEHVWVEALPADVDPASGDASERPWIQADDAFFVIGFERVGVMGTPVLAFASEAEANGAATRLHARALRWTEVVTTLGGIP